MALFARGIKNCHGRSMRSANFILNHLAMRIAHRESLDSVFPQSPFFSFLFPCRVPSDALRLIRAYSNDAMGTFPHIRQKIRRAPMWRSADIFSAPRFLVAKTARAALFGASPVFPTCLRPGVKLFARFGPDGSVFFGA